MNQLKNRCVITDYNTYGNSPPNTLNIDVDGNYCVNYNTINFIQNCKDPDATVYSLANLNEIFGEIGIIYKKELDNLDMELYSKISLLYVSCIINAVFPKIDKELLDYILIKIKEKRFRLIDMLPMPL